MWGNGSSAVVATCTASSATASSDNVRWREPTANSEVPKGRQERVSAMPSTTLALSSTSVTAPVPRVAYQSAEGP